MERGLTPELENTIRYFIDHQVQEAFLKFRQQDDQAVLQELRHQRELMQQMQQNMDKRFEAIDKRFEQMQQNMDKRFEENRYYMDKRFEDLMHHTDKRFEDMDKRFRLMQWTMVIGFSILSVMMTVFKFVA